jgi:hypothetical protein
MSALKVAGLAGYEVQDWAGLRVGTIAGIERDAQGRTRWLRVELDGGGEARVASFRADLDVAQKTVSLRLSQDLLIARAAISSPSI